MNTIDHDAVHSALGNPLILTTIFEFMSTYSLKGIRAVSSSWNEIASSILGRQRTIFNLKVGSSAGRASTRQTLPIQPQLVRRLKIVDCACGCDCDTEVFPCAKKSSSSSLSPRERKDYLKKQQHVLNFLRMYSDLVEELQFFVDYEFYPVMKSIFGEFDFPKLRKISIHQLNRWKRAETEEDEDSDDDSDDEELEEENSDEEQQEEEDKLFPNDGKYGAALQKVTNLQYCAASGERKYGRDFALEGGHPFLPAFQELINQSPNLAKVKVIGNIYPDLSKSRKIKYLQWWGFPLEKRDDDDDDDDDGDDRMSIRTEFRMRRVDKLLKQVAKNGLEKLVLRSSVFSENGIDWDDYLQNSSYMFPHFPKLTSLEIGPTNGFTMDLGNLSQTTFPNLQILKYFERPGTCCMGAQFKYLDNPENNNGGVWANLKELTLSPLFVQCQHALPTLHKIIKNYPNLSRLQLNLCGYSLMKLEKFLFGFLKELATLAKAWDKLVIRIESDLGLSQLIDGIGKAGFTGLNCLQLEVDDPDTVWDDKPRHFEDAFLSIPRIRFVGFAFKEYTMYRMREVIEANSLNVKFRN